jgi:hypothetical protein
VELNHQKRVLPFVSPEFKTGAVMIHRNFALGLVALTACLVLGVFWQCPMFGQPPAAPVGLADKVGRYQVSVCTTAAVLCDTETGVLWMSKYEDGKWQDWHGIPSPVKK